MRFVNRSAMWVVCLLLTFFAGLIHASVLEEVVVTAQKREQNLQDVGIAVTALSGDQMEQLGLREVPGIGSKFDPNVHNARPWRP